MRAWILDHVPPQLRVEPPELQINVGSHSEAEGRYHVLPNERGEAKLGEAYVRYQTAKLGNGSRPPKPIPDTVWRNDGDQLYVVQRRGLDVAVVEGFPPETTPALLEAAFRAKKTEMKPDKPPAPQT